MYNCVGPAYRRCFENSTWDYFINTTLCRNVRLVGLSERVNMLQDILNNNINEGVRDMTAIFNVTDVQTVSEELVVITDQSRGGIPPTDLDTTIEIIDVITQ